MCPCEGWIRYCLFNGLFSLQRSLQKITFSQSRSHFLRQVKSLPQVGQVFWGRFCFLTPRKGLGGFAGFGSVGGGFGSLVLFVFVADIAGFAEENGVFTDVHGEVADAFDGAGDEDEVEEVFRTAVGVFEATTE